MSGRNFFWQQQITQSLGYISSFATRCRLILGKYPEGYFHSENYLQITPTHSADLLLD